MEAGLLRDDWTRSGDAAAPREHSEHHTPARKLKVISWNLFYGRGARVTDVAALIAKHKPDLLLMQEVTEDIAALPSLAGGYFSREPMHSRIYGLAAWSPTPFPRPSTLLLPVTTIPGGVPPRIAQVLRLADITFANVHLSHGQFLNRWQLLHITRTLEGPAAIIGDFNAVGPVKLPGFRDVGPREPTHQQRNVFSFRLDRCLVRGVNCSHGKVLERGPSDHHPIVLELHAGPDNAHAAQTKRKRVAHISGIVLSKLRARKGQSRHRS